jgi:cytochrome P450
MALLTEWCMAELVRHPAVQARVCAEADAAVGADGCPNDADVARMLYLQPVVKEMLCAHPPGLLLSWARHAIADVPLYNGMVVPAVTTAMVNMWTITPTTPPCGPTRTRSRRSGSSPPRVALIRTRLAPVAASAPTRT